MVGDESLEFGLGCPGGCECSKTLVNDRVQPIDILRDISLAIGNDRLIVSRISTALAEAQRV